MSCWYLKTKVPYLIGGRFGDICQCLRAFREIYRLTLHPPTVVTSSEFCSIYDGVSYVDPIPVDGHWSEEINKMKAATGFRDMIALQSWNDPSSPEFLSPQFQRGLALKAHGRSFNSPDSHYGESMMRCAGFGWDESIWLPLVFDRRNYERESDLLHSIPSKKPLLLYNFSAVSSPFGYMDAMWPLLQRFKADFHLVDIGKIKAHRIYDLIGLYDAAAGLITCDTVTLHLAPASNIPYIAFTQNGWLGSVPHGNCVLQIPYNQTVRRLQEVRAVLKHWASESKPNLLVSQS